MIQSRGVMVESVLIRVLLVAGLGFAAVALRPGGEPMWMAAAVGCGIGVVAVLIERRLEKISLKRLTGMAAGLVVGLLCAVLVNTVLTQIGRNDWPGLRLAQIVFLAVLAYFGAAVGAAKGDLFQLGRDSGAGTGGLRKILDTSVIIDGRIADIAETGFLDGVLVVPQFVLQELQTVADSGDSMKRTRGRRGLDVLQRIQKMPQVKVQVVSDDFPNVKEVDMKLIELASLYQCKIVTNDFNLNKVARVRGVEVLNINELTNLLKPVVLPGELMRVVVAKEGKEHNQGVAYLDDGTMVVIDNARRMINKTIDVTVTSVLQTTAGKMIFGKFEERPQTASLLPAERREAQALRREQTVGE